MQDRSNGGNGTNGNGNGKGQSPGSIATQFKKGNQAAAGHGRPKGSGIKQQLDKIGEEWSSKDEGLTKLEYVCRKLWEKAAKGDQWAINILFDRLEGKPRQTIEMTDDSAAIGQMDDDQLEQYMIEHSRN